MNRDAFTLMEVIIAALILSLAVGGVLFVLTAEKGAIGAAGRKVQAMDFARQTLEELKNAVRADTWPDAGDLGSTGSAISRPILPGEPSDFRDNFGASRIYRVTDIDVNGDNEPDYKRVEVTVEWNEP